MRERWRLRGSVIVLVLILPWVSGCTPMPKPLSPEATVAFHATRVVKVLDVVRDAAIAANELVPPVISTDDTRKVVLWHKSAVQVIQAAPSGWKATVKATLYALTCHPMAGGTQPCTPQLPPQALTRLYPYVGLAVTVINEVP